MKLADIGVETEITMPMKDLKMPQLNPSRARKAKDAFEITLRNVEESFTRAEGKVFSEAA